ncbi:AEC family transporter [Hydrogenovibrio thermophilus]|uniref:AEC family transporter n=1 Tax=Hydrogenovibrio thermophilus TaxID=265883 RepID=A0A451G444_9GAMM|nr:AEC family transporter [Hydrogenovibrio thermophilus]QAB14228.1 AEC family transporter [Hydrogenovibrio thermophilus]
MLGTLSILLPIFGLIAAGFISRKTGVMGQTAASELNRFVVWLALPALLFDIMANSNWSALYLPDFILVYLIGSVGLFVLVLIWRLKQGVPLADASIDSVSAAYSNTGYVGFPLLFLVFGASSQVPTTIASIIVVSIVFAMAIILIETGLQAEASLRLKIKNVLKAVFLNPLIVSPIAGMLFALSSWQLPQGVETFLTLLGGAASPAALISLGLFLADAVASSNDNTTAARKTAWQLTAIKLIAQPLLVAWLALSVFEMDYELAMMAILLAALPTGTGPFMLAEYYRREAVTTAQTVLFSTVLSLVTLTLLLSFM